MNNDILKLWDAAADALRVEFTRCKLNSYGEILRVALTEMSLYKDELGIELVPDPHRITEVDDGDYQGLLVLLVPTGDYQPSTYWITTVFYGSCSGCDTLQAANDETDEQRAKEYWTLALNMIQSMRKVIANGKVIGE